jgi:hypothetical protein
MDQAQLTSWAEQAWDGRVLVTMRQARQALPTYPFWQQHSPEILRRVDPGQSQFSIIA